MIAGIVGNAIRLVNGDVSAYKRGDVIRLTVSPEAGMRDGSLNIHYVDERSGVLYTGTNVNVAVPTACVGDYVAIDRGPRIVADADHHHATLVAYLLAAVDRSDWHAVSDAANDLRVLEAIRR
jgi:hypothetical protein